MKTLLLTGQTYPLRRTIRALNGRWDNEQKGWLIPITRIEAVKALGSNLTITEVESPENAFAPMTSEERRAHIQGIRDRRAARLLKSAELRDSKASDLRSQTQPYMSDIAFTTQPITPGAGGRAFSKFRNKVYAKIDKEFSLMDEAEELRERAERLQAPVAIKGDAEARRQAKRDLNDSLVTIGSYVNTYIFGKGTIIKINKKTYTIECDNGAKGILDKSFIELIK